jgi:hypothetical protein
VFGDFCNCQTTGNPHAILGPGFRRDDGNWLWVKRMDWFTPSISFLAAIIGGFVAHYLSISRERASKRRELVTKHLIEIWNDFEIALAAENMSELKKYERAMSNIQLFGSKKLIELAKSFNANWIAGKSADSTDLRNNLRAELRKELGLDIASEEIWQSKFRTRQSKTR